MPEVTKNYELCIACGCTRNSKGDGFCRECGYEIEEEKEDECNE